MKDINDMNNETIINRTKNSNIHLKISDMNLKSDKLRNTKISSVK